MICKSVAGKDFLYRYLPPERFQTKIGFNHPDPNFDEYSYGEGGSYTSLVRKNVRPGSYVFFHAAMEGKRYITAFFVVSEVIEGYEARKDKRLRNLYKNPHLDPSIVNYTTDDILIFGDPELSMDLRNRLLLFDRKLSEKLDFEGKPIRFDTIDKSGRRRSNWQCINGALIAPRYLSKNDVKILLDKIGAKKDE